MSTRLSTPAAHRLLTSPAGRLFETRAFERLKLASVPREFGVQRARAAADAAIDARKGYASAARFLAELPSPPSPALRERVEAALDAYERTREDHEAAVADWEAALWGETETSMRERVALETRRRDLGARRYQPTREFGFLRREHVLPPLKTAVPTPEVVFAEWADELARPDRLYGFDGPAPAVERSRAVRGPGTVEYLLRFDSPAAWLGDEDGPDVAFARVYEPDTNERYVHDGFGEGGRTALPTVVWGSGWGMAYDQLPYWPEEEYVGRRLARRGFRVVLPEYPWHGRRTPVGEYSGERYLATAPVGLFQLYAAAAVETGILVDWAREHGAPDVVVGGTSLGGVVALHVASWCDHWPASMSPDAVVPVIASGDVPATVVGSDLPRLLGLDDALDAAGWTGSRLRDLDPLLSPSTELELSPKWVYPVLGEADDVVPYESALARFEEWGVPRSNVTTWDVGHVGALVRVIREDDLVETLTDLLSEPPVTRAASRPLP
jgi:hypothetical protein